MQIYADSVTKHIGSFQIPCLGSCPLSIDWKISLISLARYVISGHSDRSPILLPDNGFITLGIGFKLIILLRKSTQISFKEQSATVYN